MKTVENLIFDKRFKDAEFDPNDYNDWAKENEYEAYTLCLAVAKQLQIHSVVRSFCRCGKPHDDWELKKMRCSYCLDDIEAK